MPVVVSDIVSERGKADAARHREKQRDAIKRQLPEVIAEESIITGSRKGKKVRIPIKEIQVPVFRHGSGKGDGVGVGQGKGKAGDVLGKSPAPGNKPGEAGSEPGVDYIYTEMDLEELIEMMLEGLGLPRLEKKDVREIIVELGYKIKGTQHTGPMVLINRTKTQKEGFRRFEFTLQALMDETACDELTCFRALMQADGVYTDALALIKSGEITESTKEVTPFPIVHAGDRRFHRIERNTALQSQAAVILMRDASGSMDYMKVHFAQALSYWFVEFLRKLFPQVEIRFILHDTRAWFVNEEDFFKIATTSGGTQCSSAYELADSTIGTDYPLNRFNVYAFHFSDGDDFHPERSANAALHLLERGINMLGYCELRPGEGRGGSMSALLKYLCRVCNLEEKRESGLEVYVNKDPNMPIFGLQIRDKEDLLPAIKTFLKQDRWVES